jgi:flagellar hook-basal body complex protein FliE
MSNLKPITSISSFSVSDALNRATEMAQRAAGNIPDMRSQGVGFADRMRESLDAVAKSQMEAAELVRDFETGKETDLTKVMVSQQISSLGFQLTLNVRNKALSAYKDIMNMPV